jgi:flagellin
MSISLLTNIGSLIASNQVTAQQNLLNQSVAQLSSGRRIVNAADDPAGLAIAMQTSGTLAGLGQANANDSNAQAFLQTTDGALSNIGNILTTMQQVATEAADGSFSGSQLSDLQTQYASLYSQIDQISSGAQFNGIALLSGANPTFQIGASNSVNSQLTVALPTISAASLLNSTTPAAGTTLVAGTNVNISAPVGVAADVALGATAASSTGLQNQAAAAATNANLSSNAPASVTLKVISVNNGANNSGAGHRQHYLPGLRLERRRRSGDTLRSGGGQLAITNVDGLGFDLQVGNAADTFNVGDQVTLNFGTAGAVSNVSTQGPRRLR